MLRSLSRPLSNGQTTSNDIAGSDLIGAGGATKPKQLFEYQQCRSELVSGYPRQSDDVYETPAWVTWAVSPYLHEYCHYLLGPCKWSVFENDADLARCRIRMCRHE